MTNPNESDSEGRSMTVERQAADGPGAGGGEKGGAGSGESRPAVRRGVFFLVIGPSGVGKNTLITKVLRKHPDIRYLVTVTTRPRRPGEREGDPYHFVTRQEFDQKIARGDLIEWKQIHSGEYYGCPRQPVDDGLAAGVDLMKDIDVLGAQDVLAAYPADVVPVFVATSSMADLEKRIRGRSHAPEAEVQERLARARMEMEHQDRFKYLLYNDDLAVSAEQLARIVAEERVAREAGGTGSKSNGPTSKV
ncbi:MAG: guanylate kinase [Planctomycetes bacterium]|nr:guanylate kinase [Planctomycetota bacterium]